MPVSGAHVPVGSLTYIVPALGGVKSTLPFASVVILQTLPGGSSCTTIPMFGPAWIVATCPAKSVAGEMVICGRGIGSSHATAAIARKGLLSMPTASTLLGRRVDWEDSKQDRHAIPYTPSPVIGCL